ncbi:LysR family transcriptional regulator [Ruminiclostridium cellulolyticum]|uniref:Transcriptional regulator, LysR family n=1 Tax=Ruminiclostridium cellulolyticum (strain ATCC 35319 / DSM 5812 / JCM 6584 / H10) TaxID=394503 RepID=B8I6I8_RUMCH|nr:LysR family transcriptional regulator [Ruminiclostridium cellulolyticum]ACL74880.1 transcriptional regulator, LysR family [Ruminiclostridium cellulolyticum H10]
MDINFELYKIFYHCAENKSFSAAARKLFITQSAVSQSVKSLEKQLGITLFHRKSRNIQLTNEGELLFSYVSQAYNFLKTAEEKLKEFEGLTAGEIRIGVSDSICKYFVMPYIKKFGQMYPNIMVKVINRTTPQLLDVLKGGLIDIAISTLPVNEDTFNAAPFISVQDIFVASDKFKELKGREISLQELNGYPLVLLQSDSSTRKSVDRFFQNQGLTCSPEIELESLDLLVEFAKIGTGIACVLKESAVDAIKSGDLFQIKSKEPLPPRSIGVVTMKNVVLSKAVKTFISELI